MALWVIHTHLRDQLSVTPRLSIRSGTPGCGKTVLLDAIESLVYRPVSASNLSSAVLFRVIEKHGPTLLIDEADENLRQNRNPELLQVLNAGHRRGGYVWRCVGDDHEPEKFNVFGPVAYAGIGKFGSPAARTREINVIMDRPPPDLLKKIASANRSPALDEGAELHRRIKRWAIDSEDAFAHSYPDLPDELTGRPADNWRPLIAIADLIGGAWPEKAREAARAISGSEGSIDGNNVKIQLLSDFKTIFSERGDRVFTRDILEDLHEMESRPWPEFGRQQKPITARGVSKLLDDWSVGSRTMRIGDENAKGYEEADFEKLFLSYLPPEGDALSVTASQVNGGGGLLDSLSVTTGVLVTDRKQREPNNDGGCDVVTDRNAGAAETEENWGEL